MFERREGDDHEDEGSNYGQNGRTRNSRWREECKERWQERLERQPDQNKTRNLGKREQEDQLLEMHLCVWLPFSFSVLLII